MVSAQIASCRLQVRCTDGPVRVLANLFRDSSNLLGLTPSARLLYFSSRSEAVGTLRLQRTKHEYLTMRRRVTFLHRSSDYFDPNQLQLHKDSLVVTSLKAAREERLTFGLYELPQEVLDSEVYQKTTPSSIVDLSSYGEP